MKAKGVILALLLAAVAVGGNSVSMRTAPRGPRAIEVSTARVQKLGVRTEPAARRALGKSLRAVGRVEPDERRVHVVAPRFEGYVERLYVDVTGQYVRKGQPLFDVYSPELVSAQREYSVATQDPEAMNPAGSDVQIGMRQLADASLARLRNWDLSAEQLNSLVATGQAARVVTLRAPAEGIVTTKKAVQGMRVMAGEVLYEITDLSSVWVLADISARDAGLVRNGSKATVRVDAYPDAVFEGSVSYVYPTLNPETRTLPVRIELTNPARLLKPAMFTQVELQVGGSAPVLALPDSAVIDSGIRRIVLVGGEEGRFEAREVRIGMRSDNHVEVLGGVREGEDVVVAPNFLIDSESDLEAAIAGLGAVDGSDVGRR